MLTEIKKELQNFAFSYKNHHSLYIGSTRINTFLSTLGLAPQNLKESQLFIFLIIMHN